MQKIENFRKAVANLGDARARRDLDDIVTLTGLVALFSICFDCAWKAMKWTLERHGFGEAATGSPRQIVKLAFSVKMIDDEKEWLEVLQARNEAAYSYGGELAKKIVFDVRDRHLQAFETLLSSLEKDWLPCD